MIKTVVIEIDDDPNLPKKATEKQKVDYIAKAFNSEKYCYDSIYFLNGDLHVDVPDPNSDLEDEVANVLNAAGATAFVYNKV